MAALSGSGSFPGRTRAAIFHTCRPPVGGKVDSPKLGAHYGKPCGAAPWARDSAVALGSAANSNQMHRTESGRFP